MKTQLGVQNLPVSTSKLPSSPSAVPVLFLTSQDRSSPCLTSIKESDDDDDDDGGGATKPLLLLLMKPHTSQLFEAFAARLRMLLIRAETVFLSCVLMGGLWH